MEAKIPLAYDHSMIVKFDSTNHPGYTSARDRLRQFEKDAPKVVAARFGTYNVSVKRYARDKIS
jgi:protein SERAC1